MRKILFIVFFLLMSFVSFSQQFGVHLGLGFPMNEFKDNMNRTGAGGSVDALIVRTGPASMGLNFGYYNYGNETRRERFSTTIPDVMVDVTRSNNIANLHLLFQVAPPFTTVIPYAEGLFGGSYIFTDTQIDSRENDVASSTNFDDFAWSYGAGGGIMIHLLTDPAEIQPSEILLDIKVRYLFGTEAEYLKEGSITIRDGRAYYDVQKSKTDLLTATVGVVLRFNSIF